MLGSLILRNLKLRRDAPAIIFEDRLLTHGAFAARAFRLVGALRRLGVGRGDRVAILAQNCPEYLETYAAGELGGWITVPINYRLAEPEIAYILSDSRPKVLIVETQFLDRIGEVTASCLEHVLTIGDDGPDIAYEAAVMAVQPDSPSVVVGSDDTAYLIYTSGTTGRPKGVMLRHGGQLWAAQVSVIEMGVRPSDRVAVAMPLYHIGARNTCLTRNVHGCPIVLHRSFRPAAFFESLQRHAVTETLLAPTMLNDLLQHFPDPRQALPSLQRIFYSAAPMPEAILRRGIAALGSIFAQVYGMTESGGPGCILHQHQHVLEGEEKIVRRLRSAGQPMFGCDVRVVDAAGHECAVGELGEIVIRSEGLMQGYWDNPTATAEALRGGYLHTGDVGQVDDDGFVFIMDRLKDMIVSGGENIYSREIEDAIISHPAIAEAAVVGAPDERWGERVVAFVVKKPGQDASAEAIIEHCRQKIASYKRPKQVFFLDGLPKLPNGKIEKFKLRDPLWANRSRAI